MKTNTYNKFFMLAVALMMSLAVYAYDAEIDGIYYNFNYETKEASVTHNGNTYWDWDAGVPYSGDVTIPSTVTFDGTTYNVTSIGEYAFYRCYGYLSSVIIPESVTSIEDHAFDNCSGLSSVDFPESLTSIGKDAFAACVSLSSVTIPESVTSIGEGAFHSCNSLTSIIVDDDNNFYDSRDYCNAIIKTETNELIAGCSNSTIPSSVTCIASFAFYRLSTLTHIDIPSSVTNIAENAVSYNSQLSGITVNNDNPYYDSRDNCNAIIHTATNELIVGCDNTIIPHDVASIGNNAFANCSGLSAVTLPESLMSIGDYAFESCKGLTSVIIPESVTHIGDYTFCNCNSLASVILPESVTSIGENAFAGCPFTSINIPSSLTSIAKGTFYSTGLTAVTIPESVTSIGDEAFHYCMDLTSVTIPESVTSIGFEAFECCMSLTSFTIPASAQSIGSRAFNWCYNLNAVTNLSKTPQEIDSETFSVYGDLHVLKGYKEVYQDAEVWKNFNIIDDVDDATVISTIATEDIAADKIYTLSGKRLSVPQKGINIINGKKVVIK